MLSKCFAQIKIKALAILALLLISSSVFADNASPWKVMAENDLAMTKMLMSKNDPKAQVTGTSYAIWLEQGYKEALDMSQQIDSFSGYISVMRFYLNGFHDFHTSVVPLLEIINPSIKWPGFVVGQRSGKITVIERSKEQGYWKDLPEVGAQLVSCDGFSATQLLNKNLIPFYPLQKDIPSTWAAYIPKLFIWDGNPFAHQPMSCKFLEGKSSITYDLRWQVVSKPNPLSLGILDFPKKVSKAAFGQTPPFEMTNFGQGAVWISIPTFARGLSIQGKTTDQWLTKIANKVSKLRKAKLIVFDLRGNTGGDPEYSYPIIQNLYSNEFLKSLGKDFLLNQTRETLFTVNQDNLDYLVKSKSPQPMINGMKKAIVSGEKSFVYQDNSFDIAISQHENPVKAKVVLLTDGRCASECTNFVMTLKSIPGVIQLGQPTAPLTNSTWNTVYVFKDNAAAIVYPIGLIVSPKIKDGKPLYPDVTYKGFIGNKKALQSWIWQLYLHLWSEKK